MGACVPALAPCLPSPPTKCRLRLGLAVAAVNHNFPKIECRGNTYVALDLRSYKNGSSSER